MKTEPYEFIKHVYVHAFAINRMQLAVTVTTYNSSSSFIVGSPKQSPDFRSFSGVPGMREMQICGMYPSHSKTP
jgi:hypothetical protein